MEKTLKEKIEEILISYRVKDGKVILPEAVSYIAQEIQEAIESKWIPVSESYPKPKIGGMIKVAVLMNGAEEEVLEYFEPDYDEGSDHRFYKGYWKHWDDLTDQVTHWMYLPTPPNKGE